MVGQVEHAIRKRFPHIPAILHTLGQGRPFKVSLIDGRGVVLVLGRATEVRLPWTCLESVPMFLRQQGGWVRAGGAHSVSG